MLAYHKAYFRKYILLQKMKTNFAKIILILSYSFSVMNIRLHNKLLANYVVHVIHVLSIQTDSHTNYYKYIIDSHYLLEIKLT